MLAAWTATAQVSTATLSGRIVDENGPIEGVTVVAIHQPTNAQYYATTGRGGWWQLLGILPGPGLGNGAGASVRIFARPV